MPSIFRAEEAEEVAYEYDHRMPKRSAPSGYEYTKRKLSQRFVARKPFKQLNYGGYSFWVLGFNKINNIDCIDCAIKLLK